MKIEQMAEQVVAAARGFVERALAPIKAQIAAAEARAAKDAEKMDSMERRASRHASHLASLEDRVRKLEGK